MTLDAVVDDEVVLFVENERRVDSGIGFMRLNLASRVVRWSRAGSVYFLACAKGEVERKE